MPPIRWPYPLTLPSGTEVWRDTPDFDRAAGNWFRSGHDTKAIAGKLSRWARTKIPESVVANAVARDRERRRKRPPNARTP
jgi:hypothetical protein